jgi:hypothetical protein
LTSRNGARKSIPTRAIAASEINRKLCYNAEFFGKNRDELFLAREEKNLRLFEFRGFKNVKKY